MSNIATLGSRPEIAAQPDPASGGDLTTQPLQVAMSDQSAPKPDEKTDTPEKPAEEPQPENPPAQPQSIARAA